jgi:hypothetical protein
MASNVFVGLAPGVALGRIISDCALYLAIFVDGIVQSIPHTAAARGIPHRDPNAGERRNPNRRLDQHEPRSGRIH